MTAATKTRTEEIVEFLLTPAGRELSNKQIAERFEVDPGTVSRARLKVQGTYGGFLTELPVGSIQADFAYQVRDDQGGLDREAVEDYADAYRAGEPLPPVVVTPIDGHMKLVVGFHRYFGARKAGLEKIAVEVVDNLTPLSILCLASKSNTTNGKRFTRADRAKAARVIVLACPEYLEQEAKVGSGKGLGRKLAAASGLDESSIRKAKRTILEERALEANGPPADEPQGPVGDEGDGNDPGPEEIPSTTVPTPKAPAPGDDDDDDDDDRDDLTDGDLSEEDRMLVTVARQRHAILSTLPTADILELRRSPIFNDLHGEQLRCLVEEYLTRRDMADALQSLSQAYRDARAKYKGKIQPVLTRSVEIVLKRPTFDGFSLCSACGGKGCSTCYKRGYIG